ncbi:hypothetical protein LX64_02029 [Chitinophaga skermanii]|uniref:DUF5723 domain-containing protein n=1 Tax=Chitinophaga skermanii TaxID=331697 RepID=A0A327QRL3_9BACT|nr:DUF5723 family protein [Chitinophaga skermanii]RAJ06901.1 hypothetical protein LX64_02029 [Chitinophaga skermanii]
MNTRYLGILFGLICLLSNVKQSCAQSFGGYTTSHYAGIYAVPFNPAMAAGYHSKWDINIIGADMRAGNTYAFFKKSSLLHPPEKLVRNRDYYFDTLASGKQFGWGAGEIMLPAVLYSIDTKQAVAFTWRVRGFGNIGHVSTETANLFAINYPNTKYLDRTLSEPGANGSYHAWNEFAFTYARTLQETYASRLKVGATLKILSGLTAAYGSAGDAIFRFNSNGTINVNSGQARFGYNNELDSANNSFGDYYKLSAHPGIGVDIGLTYDVRDEDGGFGDYEEEGNESFNPEADDYKLRLGISITDIGRIAYNTSIVSQHVNLTTQSLHVNDLRQRRGESDKLYLLRLGTYFEQLPVDQKYKMSLPTTLHLMGDYKITSNFYVSANADIALTSGVKNDRKSSAITQLLVTPRYDAKHIGVYLPFSVNRYSQADAGIALRAGPLVIGSNSLFTNLARKNLNRADAFVALRVIPIKFRKKDGGDGIFRRKKQQMGCPI